MSDRRLQLAEDRRPGKRLGRHVNQDPRSLRYLIPETSTPETVRWDRRIPVLDQGDLGSCTGNATIGVLGTDPYFSQLTPVQRQALGEAEAVRVYSLATQLDPWPGDYPPDDTGSDGLSAAKAAQKLGYLSGYQHITSVAAAHQAIKSGPFMSGLNWLSDMDTPDSRGVVRATGYVRGGHEWEFAGYDAATGLWECWNSWGDSWGREGRFYLPDEDYAALLAQQGDATVLVPVTQPAPQPQPQPVPTFPLAEAQPWLDKTYSWTKAERRAKAAINAWLDSGSH